MENLDLKKTSNYKFWKNKKVLVTGHTGFKGAWLVIWLNKMGAKVTGIGLKPKTNSNLYNLCKLNEICKSYIFDIRDKKKFLSHFKMIKPEIVFHLAAQSIVKKSYIDPFYTASTNILGTLNLLENIRLTNCTKVAIMVTTDKVYLNSNKKKKFKETDHLGGFDLYSGSKASSEIIIESYKKSFFDKKKIAISSARAGNVIGGGDWSEYRLIPDIIQSSFNKKNLLIRNPNSVRPWQHVLDTLAGYIVLAKFTWKNFKYSGAYNFAPITNKPISVKEVLRISSNFIKVNNIHFKKSNKFYETTYLNLNSLKTLKLLKFKTKWSMKKSIEKTIKWYFYQKNNPKKSLNLCLKNIEDYEKKID